MTIQQLLDLGDGVSEMSDEKLSAHLAKYFPQTRATTAPLEEHDEVEMPAFLREAMAAEKPDKRFIDLG